MANERERLEQEQREARRAIGTANRFGQEFNCRAAAYYGADGVGVWIPLKTAEELLLDKGRKG